MEQQNHAINELVSQLVLGTTYEMLDAVEAIGAHGTTAVGTVVPLLRSQNRETRWRGALAMGRIGAPSIEALMTAARDADYQVRVPAIWALEQIGDRRAVAALVENLHGENECCRWMAAAVLTRIGGEFGQAVVERAFADDPVGWSIVEELIEDTSTPVRPSYRLASGAEPVTAPA